MVATLAFVNTIVPLLARNMPMMLSSELKNLDAPAAAFSGLKIKLFFVEYMGPPSFWFEDKREATLHRIMNK